MKYSDLYEELEIIGIGSYVNYFEYSQDLQA